MTARYITSEQLAHQISLTAEQQQFEILISNQLTQKQWADWDEFIPSGNLMLQHAYLSSIASTLFHDKSIQFVQVLKGKKLVGAFPVQLIWAESSNLEGNTEKKNSLVQNMIRKILVGDGPLRFRLAVIGNSFASGENGYHFSSELNVVQECTIMNAALEEVVLLQKESQFPIKALLVKDFLRGKDELNLLQKMGFAEFKVDPLMIMPIDPEWNNREDYLAVLKSKFRTKAKGAYKKSAELEMRELEHNEIRKYEKEIHHLYHEVVDKADFNLGHLEAVTFADMKENLGSQFDFLAYFFEDKLVGFQSGFRHGDLYDAHMIGVDYSQNQRWSLYSRILYQYVDLAIDAGAIRLSYGRTAGEIKSTVGAFPVDLSCCVRHVNPVPNVLLKNFFRFVKPKNYEIRYPYKQELEIEAPSV